MLVLRVVNLYLFSWSTNQQGFCARLLSAVALNRSMRSVTWLEPETQLISGCMYTKSGGPETDIILQCVGTVT